MTKNDSFDLALFSKMNLSLKQISLYLLKYMYETLTNKAVKFRFHAQLEICAYVKIIKFIKLYQIIMIPFR